MLYQPILASWTVFVLCSRVRFVLYSRVRWFGSLCIHSVCVSACSSDAVVKVAVFAERGFAGWCDTLSIISMNYCCALFCYCVYVLYVRVVYAADSVLCVHVTIVYCASTKAHDDARRLSPAGLGGRGGSEERPCGLHTYIHLHDYTYTCTYTR